MEKEKIYIAADHGGYAMKEALKSAFADRVEWVDLGADSDARTDFPLYAKIVADELKGAADGQKAVLICGSGIGVSISANRYPWVHAALCVTEEMAVLAREHNNANVLVLGGRIIDQATAEKCLNAFLNTAFLGGRYAERIDMIGA
ncbi:MAG: RpiB/LacA/LacB family sugar-phosphate isomerase [Pseudomonadota bacterium]|jgi:ribose 5-phosphate isomerase B|nr:RpiB/LacA/LacB family sugar-phosphate isomerase [Pseudomonadota bacterium]